MKIDFVEKLKEKEKKLNEMSVEIHSSENVLQEEKMSLNKKQEFIKDSFAKNQIKDMKVLSSTEKDL